MKALGFSLALLLPLCCCDAMLVAVQYSTAPGSCCFNFSTRRLPDQLVSHVSHTHASCLKRGFIVQTVKGRTVCYQDTFPWAVNIYKQLNSAEGSGQQQL
ncbi:C-C motif chemokine 4-like [Menidia menidia]